MSDSGEIIKGYDPASLGSPTGPPPRGGRGSRNKVGPKFIFHLSGARRPKRARNDWQDTYGVGAPHPKRGPPRELFYFNTPPIYYILQSFAQNSPLKLIASGFSNPAVSATCQRPCRHFCPLRVCAPPGHPNMGCPGVPTCPYHFDNSVHISVHIHVDRNMDRLVGMLWTALVRRPGTGPLGSARPQGAWGDPRVQARARPKKKKKRAGGGGGAFPLIAPSHSRYYCSITVLPRGAM